MNPLTITVDTREHAPLPIPATIILPPSDRSLRATPRTLHLLSTSTALDPGDYGLAHDPSIRIERKCGLDEVASALASGLLASQCKRLSLLPHSLLLWEIPTHILLNPRPTTHVPQPHTVISVLLEMLADFKIPLLTASSSNRYLIGELAARWLLTRDPSLRRDAPTIT